MHAFRIEPLLIGHLEQLCQDVAADLSRARMPRNPEAITATGDFDIEAAFDLPQVFIKLTAQIGKAVVIGGLEDYVPRYLDSTQNLFLKPLCRKAPVRTTGKVPEAAINLFRQ